MNQAFKPLLLILALTILMVSPKVFAQMTEVPFPEPQDLLAGRNQRITQIKASLDNIQQGLGNAYQQLNANGNYLESNKLGLNQRLVTIRQIENDFNSANNQLRAREIELQQRCPLSVYGQPMCPPQIFNPLVGYINQVRNHMQSLLQTRQQFIYAHQNLFADTVQAVNRINAIKQNIEFVLASRNELASELARLSQLDPNAVVGFNFGNGEVSNIKPPASLPAETRTLIEKAKTSLVQVDSQIEKAQATAVTAETILGETKRTLENVKKTLNGTPASELDFGDL